ncbi:MAG TPA: response regulator transcription factor [Acidimicrobiales bacterium]|nr:response regulator transcription factor [Acidimicrobiales bacterium]
MPGTGSQLDDDQVRVLVVEDEESYREAMSSGLQVEGYHVELAADGIEGLARFTEDPPDIVLLDVLLPGISGIEVCRRMRSIADVPIVMVSAVDTELDVVLGLELGAADYVTKPFHLRELVARIQAVLRRVSPPGTTSERTADTRRRAGTVVPGSPRADVLFGSVLVNFARRSVTRDDDQIHLSRREFDLLDVLLAPPGQVRTRDELIDLLWPHRDLADSRTLDTHVHRLRSKLEPDPSNPRFIVTVRGVGFRVDPEGAPPVPAPRTNPE